MSDKSYLQETLHNLSMTDHKRNSKHLSLGGKFALLFFHTHCYITFPNRLSCDHGSLSLSFDYPFTLGVSAGVSWNGMHAWPVYELWWANQLQAHLNQIWYHHYSQLTHRPPWVSIKYGNCAFSPLLQPKMLRLLIVFPLPSQPALTNSAEDSNQ